MAPRSSQEFAVKHALEEAGLEFAYQRRVPFPEDSQSGKPCATLDFLLERPWGYTVLEVDEWQHRSVSRDPRVDVRTDFDTARNLKLQPVEKLQIIRYNPNDFRVDGVDRRVSTKARLARLIAFLQEAAEPEKHFERFFFYYDSESGSSLPQVSAEWDDLVALAVSRVVA